MNIEKIKNYNQVMLAVIVTTASAFAVFGLIAFIIFIFTEVLDMFPSRNSYSETGISTVEQEFEQTADEQGKRHLAYHFPELVDTPAQIFIIPVGYRNADENQEEFSRKLEFSGSKTYGSYDGGYPYYGQKTYVNLLLYDAKNGKTDILFSRRILIGQYAVKYFIDDILVLFEAASADSNQDGLITLEDESSLFIYSLKSKILREIKMPGKSLLEFSFVGKTRDLILRFGLDPIKRGNMTEVVKSVAICRYDYALDKLEQVNNENLQKELQKIVDSK
jgi:hypothetical protein